MRRIRGFDGGREIRAFKNQLSRLSVVVVRLATTHGNRPFQTNGLIVEDFELWPELDKRQRVLWPRTIQLSLRYFESLQQHAVPLIEADLGALAHTAMGLDIYAWLAQRLHCIDPRNPAFIAWANLKEQFGPDYKRMNKFKEEFTVAIGRRKSRRGQRRIRRADRPSSATGRRRCDRPRARAGRRRSRGRWRRRYGVRRRRIGG